MTPTRFDIYLRSGGRWSRRESFPGNLESHAIARAGQLDAEDGNDGVRVMVVTEYSGGRAPLETLGWISPHLSKISAVQRQMQGAVAAAVADVAGTEAAPMPSRSGPPIPSRAAAPTGRPSEPAAPAAPGTMPAGTLAVSLLTNVAVAAGLAAIAYVPLLAVSRALEQALAVRADTYGDLPTALTVFTFIVAAMVLIARTVRRQPAQAASNADTSVAANLPAPPPVVPIDVTAPPAPPAPPPGSGMTEDARRGMLAFLAVALAAIKDEVPTMTPHVAFGLNLFGAGAAERYGAHVGLTRMQAFVLVREVVAALGTPPDQIETFCRQYADYAGEARFRAMIDAGRVVMAKRLTGDPAPFANFGDALRQWTSDARVRDTAADSLCLLFTDIVGSINLPADAGAPLGGDTIRVHNAVVRRALEMHRGHELKHTGDGIVAGFKRADDAVRAAALMRGAFAAHNGRAAHLPVHVRISVHAAAGIDEDDFFAAALQQAARICEQAAAGDILTTDTVRALLEPHGFVFERAGDFDIKGALQPVALYRVGKTPPEGGAKARRSDQ